MPDPNQNDQNQNNNQTPVHPEPQMDVPPMMDESVSNSTPSVQDNLTPEPAIPQPAFTETVAEEPKVQTDGIALEEKSETEENNGSAAPSDITSDDNNSMISTPPKKKFAGGKIIATILGVLMLVGGIGGGVYLTQQQQDIRERAGSCDALCATSNVSACQACLAGQSTNNNSKPTTNDKPSENNSGNNSGSGSTGSTSTVSCSGQCEQVCKPGCGGGTASESSPACIACRNDAGLNSVGGSGSGGGSGGLTQCTSGQDCQVPEGTDGAFKCIRPGSSEVMNCCPQNQIYSGGKCTTPTSAQCSSTNTSGCTSFEAQCAATGGQVVGNNCYYGGVATCAGPVGGGGGNPCPQGSCSNTQIQRCKCGNSYIAVRNGINCSSACNSAGIQCSGDCNSPEPTPPPTTPTASCVNIKAYTEEWTSLTTSQLSNLKVGDKVNFCVNGTASTGVFNKAKFTINSAAQAETTTKRPSSNDFCQLYTIPATTTVFNITAQIHHATLGWK